jgi:hypothetical protein
MNASTKNITWQDVLDHHQESMFPCPITGAPTALDAYKEQYSVVMKQFNGADGIMYVSEYFIRSPLNYAQWEFADPEAREDFIEMCQEEGVLEEWKTIQAGDKNGSRKQSNTREWKQMVQKPKKKISAEERDTKIRDSLLATVKRLEKELASGNLGGAKELKTRQKLDRIKEKL